MTTIKVSNNIQDLTGEGAEILTDQAGNPIAEFFNGNFTVAASKGNLDITIPMIEIKEAA